MDLDFVDYVDIIYRIYFSLYNEKAFRLLYGYYFRKQNLKSFSSLPVECQENPDS